MTTINIAKDYSLFTGLRHCNISEKSGEDFYHTKLNTAFKEAFEKKDKLTIILDGVDGFAPSFLDEAFGNLVYDFGLTNVKAYLEVASLLEPQWIDMITQQTYPQWEKRREKSITPKKTITHKPWFRIVDSKIECEKWI
ncbi:STAS-like domain-containing protein [Bacteroides ihuae]|uniref:STAS-like domain-containing protein n=1 Tax=Bacteroides ihuae TaxID=1852362 RepID=UPI0008D94EF2|nr:STAS-like domain-containing protein [Bacteroides ihuae]